MNFYQSFLQDRKLSQEIIQELGIEGSKEYELGHLRALFQEFKLKIEARGVQIAIIGGTNGKGETTLWLDHLLHQKNISYSRWISPHILTFRERISFQGQLIDSTQIKDCIQLAKSRLGASYKKLSYYEFLFYVYLLWSLEILKVDCLLLEVGLGGRLDAVNILNSDVASIVSISRDHQHILGNSYAQILKEKLGIARPNKILITAFELEYLRQMAQDYCRENGVLSIDLFDLKIVCTQQTYSVRNQILAFSMRYFMTSLKKFPLLDFKQRVKDFEVEFKSDFEFQIQEVKQNLPWPKILDERFHPLKFNQSLFYFNGAHNPDAFRKMLDFYLAEKFNFDVILLSFSRRSARDVLELLRIFLAHLFLDKSVQIYLVRYDGDRVFPFWENQEIIDFVESFNQNPIERRSMSILHNIETFLSSTEDKKVLVAGSNYFVGHVKTAIFQRSFQ